MAALLRSQSGMPEGSGPSGASYASGSPRTAPAEAPHVNQATIARKVGVSQVTVSRALSGRGQVAPRTRQRILEAVEELRYAPNPLAQGLRGGRTKLVGLLRSLAGPHPSEGAIRKVAMCVQQHGYATQIVDHMSRVDVMVQTLDSFRRYGVDAVMLDGSRPALLEPEVVERLQSFPAAVVVSDRPIDVSELPVDVILHDRRPSFTEMADHLIDRGRRRPMVIMAGEGEQNSVKTRTFFDRCRARGLSIETGQDLAIARGIGSDSIGRETWAFLEQHSPERPFDAMVFSNDESAMAGIAWLRSHGKRVPTDVAVIGFNDSAGAAYVDPPLASVSREEDRVAAWIERFVFERLGDPSLPPRRECVPMRFIPRASAG